MRDSPKKTRPVSGEHLLSSRECRGRSSKSTELAKVTCSSRLSPQSQRHDHRVSATCCHLPRLVRGIQTRSTHLSVRSPPPRNAWNLDATRPTGHGWLFTFAAASVRQQQNHPPTMASAEGIQPLALSFNLRCPTPLPERPALIQWPWPIA